MNWCRSSNKVKGTPSKNSGLYKRPTKVKSDFYHISKLRFSHCFFFFFFFFFVIKTYMKPLFHDYKKMPQYII